MATFAAIAQGNSDFSILVATLAFIDDNLDGSNLIGTLNDPDQDLTVFAPTNAAFGQLAADLGFDGDTSDTAAVTAFLVDNVPVATLNAVILYHVSGGAQTAADIAGSGSVDTLQGGTIDAGELPTLGDAEPDLIDPSLIATDIMADNGVLHVIDRVLLPVDLPGNDAPTITEIVASSGPGFDHDPTDFDILLEAVITAGLADTLADADLDLTVFAPTDAAFVSLAQELGFHGSDEAHAWSYLVEALTLLGAGDPIPLLTQILTYHVAGESLQASQILGADAVTTLQGGEIGIDGTTLVDLDPDLPDPTLIATDIQAANGVVHVIDEVLIPGDILASDGRNDVDFVIANNFSNFIYTGRDADFVDGNGGNDIILSGRGADVVLGGSGRDFIASGGGRDTVNGDSGGDVILGGGARDMIDGGSGGDRIFGGHGNDMLNGGSGHDLVSGGAGRDRIDGGTGGDLLLGGGGSDTFVFGANSGRDVIRDFNEHDDQIDLSALNHDAMDDLTIRDWHGNTVIHLGDGNQIVLQGVNAHELSEDNFIF